MAPSRVFNARYMYERDKIVWGSFFQGISGFAIGVMLFLSVLFVVALAGAPLLTCLARFRGVMAGLCRWPWLRRPRDDARRRVAEAETGYEMDRVAEPRQRRDPDAASGSEAPLNEEPRPAPHRPPPAYGTWTQRRRAADSDDSHDNDGGGGGSLYETATYKQVNGEVFVWDRATESWVRA